MITDWEFVTLRATAFIKNLGIRLAVVTRIPGNNKAAAIKIGDGRLLFLTVSIGIDEELLTFNFTFGIKQLAVDAPG